MYIGFVSLVDCKAETFDQKRTCAVFDEQCCGSQENVGRVNTRSSRVHIVVFGVGATLYIIFVIVNFALRNQVLSSINNCGLLLSPIVYVIFVYKYNGASLKNRAVFHYVIALMIGADVWALILTVIHPYVKTANDSFMNSSKFNDFEGNKRVLAFLVS